jgi:hypothetical protein
MFYFGQHCAALCGGKKKKKKSTLLVALVTHMPSTRRVDGDSAVGALQLKRHGALTVDAAHARRVVARHRRRPSGTNARTSGVLIDAK